MKALVVGSGRLDDLALLKRRYQEADLVIAADGGAQYLHTAGLSPDVLVGDFDSISEATLEEFRLNKNVDVTAWPREKDYTDLELALTVAVQKGATEVNILGGVGSRLDHTLANVFLLNMLLQKGIPASVEDSCNRISLTDKSITIKKQENWKVSLLSVSAEVTHVTTSGLQYPLKDQTLLFGSSFGVSNEFIEDQAIISFEKGLLLVMLTSCD